ncbi:MAG TPA: NAD+ synthase [Candidatus Omnitrophota bacterium]|nr:NAD+ synthase [Candidatus Omnitrophota bacterium]HNQ50226.1 NAD+ synthase [Candidatus Omnitrophota bacterium]
MEKRIILWLRRQVKAAHARGVVLGLSGGLDSCVTAVLAKKALGARNVLALLMPCHSHTQDAADARIVARKFGIHTTIVDLTKTYDSLIRALPAADRMTQANIRPRLRMIALYYFARKMNYLVCGTSNKSEVAAGYFTKFGDGASDILPIGSLLKTQVRKLAVELGIPRGIIDKAPTAGLWPGQTDEGEMGITYPELDEIISRIEKKKPQRLSKAKVDKVKKLIRCSEHKRRKAACFIP